MRLTKPRIEPVTPNKLREVQLDLFGEVQSPALNVTRLWAIHPKLMAAQRNLQRHIFRDLTISQRLRELAILRIGWLCKSGYELAQHAEFGRRAGLDSNDLARITEGPSGDGWTQLESAVIRAVDEMFEDAFIGTDTWETLREELDEQQLLDLLSVVGRYWCVSVILNSTGVQLEENARAFEDHISKHGRIQKWAQ